MRILIDTNVALNYLSAREESEQIIKLCAEEKAEGYIAFHSLSTIWYVTRKLPDDLRREWLKQLCSVLTITGADHDLIIKAIENKAFKDFEDNLQDCCAQTVQADYIVTVNEKDYQGVSTVKALTPAEMLRILNE